MNAPGPWEFLLLALAAFRAWRIFARDTITADAREAVTGYDDDHAPGLDEKDTPPPRTRPSRLPAPVAVYLSALIRCPWCLGFYVSAVTAALWWAFPKGTLIVAFPLALSAALGLIRKNLDP